MVLISMHDWCEDCKRMRGDGGEIGDRGLEGRQWMSK